MLIKECKMLINKMFNKQSNKQGKQERYTQINKFTAHKKTKQ